MRKGVGLLGRSISGSEEALRRAYPGAPWEQGRTTGYYNNTAVAYELMTKRDWGRGSTPYAMMEPLMWYWARVGQVELTDRAQSRGTTWVELVEDFQI